jgi:hypothetical protein
MTGRPDGKLRCPQPDRLLGRMPKRARRSCVVTGPGPVADGLQLGSSFASANIALSGGCHKCVNVHDEVLPLRREGEQVPTPRTGRGASSGSGRVSAWPAQRVRCGPTDRRLRCSRALGHLSSLRGAILKGWLRTHGFAVISRCSMRSLRVLMRRREDRSPNWRR